jgi:hypothetical protein
MTETPPRQFLCFFYSDRDTVRCSQLLALNADPAGSVDTPEIRKLSGSGVSKIWEL